jgi:hypothetical protein
MCFNDRVSITTYLVGIAGCINLYFNYDLKVEAIFYGWVVQMQLIEYFLWNNQTCNKMNEITTKTGVIVNHLEPVILWIAILLLSNKTLPNWINILMILYVIATIYYTKNIEKSKIKCTKVTKESNPHLYWGWNDSHYSGIYYALFLGCLNVLAIYGLEYGVIQAILITLSFTISGLIYQDTKSVGAMWCFIAAFTPWILTLII